MDDVTLSLDEAYQLGVDVLTANGFADDHARSIARLILVCQQDDCNSHGLYRLISCVQTARTGKVALDARPQVTDQAKSVIRIDARGGYSPLAFELGRPLLVAKAREHAIAALAINHCYHFSALWPEVEALAEDGLAAIAMLPTHSFTAPAGGTRPLLGTNPIAFAWPRPDGPPYAFDFATSAVARGEIELHRRTGKPIPTGWAVDRSGEPTTDPDAALDGALLTFGGYKGSALSTMIELLAGPLIGDLTSLESKEHDAGANVTSFHGELIIAFDLKAFQGENAASQTLGAERLFDAIVDQGARLPSQRRYEARAKNRAAGSVTVPRELYEEIRALR